MRDEVWDALREHGKQVHAERVKKTPSRVAYAQRRFAEAGVEAILRNPDIGHFTVFDVNKRKFNFWASTGAIQAGSEPCMNARGIEACIRIAKAGLKR